MTLDKNSDFQMKNNSISARVKNEANYWGNVGDLTQKEINQILTDPDVIEMQIRLEGLQERIRNAATDNETRSRLKRSYDDVSNKIGGVVAEKARGISKRVRPIQNRGPDDE